MGVIWDFFVGHGIFSIAFFIGFPLFVIGGRYNYKSEEEMFNRRNSSGNMEFESYKESRSLGSKWTLWKSIGKIGLWLTVFSLLGLCFLHFT
ncbi:hypothetical protein CLV90_2035 [Maribacter spongiicola]|uniref:Uncharacterized protein n=1 Tax=Maribacter spongiicola TaxID=1206753 RepID=A0A4R7K359_9FLAO|nr:hypothetical protein [Maribacter spongiicola]TDT44956.1 hypothetical protein CLV90_2035 [Maribacter spongiicola]